MVAASLFIIVVVCVKGLVALDTDAKLILRLAFACLGRIIDSFQTLEVTERTGSGATILAESS